VRGTEDGDNIMDELFPDRARSGIELFPHRTIVSSLGETRINERPSRQGRRKPLRPENDFVGLPLEQRIL